MVPSEYAAQERGQTGWKLAAVKEGRPCALTGPNPELGFLAVLARYLGGASRFACAALPAG